MVTKQELIDSLNEAIRAEHVPLCIRHINSTFAMSGFEPQKKDRVQQILKQLFSASMSHIRTYKKLISHAQTENKNVY